MVLFEHKFAHFRGAANTQRIYIQTNINFLIHQKNHKPGKTYKTKNCGTDHKFLSIAKLVLLFTICIYFILCTLGLIVSMLTECKLKQFALSRFHRVFDMEMINSHLTYVKLLSSILVGFLVIRN